MVEGPGHVPDQIEFNVKKQMEECSEHPSSLALWSLTLLWL